MGPRSTAPFVDLVVTECQRQYGASDDADFAAMLIYTLPTPFYLDRPLDHAAMQAAISAGLRHLAACGVAFIAMPCNSAHIYYAQLAASVSVPLLDMVELAAQALPSTTGPIALLATRPTSAAGLYQASLAAAGRACFVDEDVQRRVDQLIGSIKTSCDLRTPRRLWRDLTRSLARAGVGTALIACTDLNAVSATAQDEIALLDATQCLARSAVQRWMALAHNVLRTSSKKGEGMMQDEYLTIEGVCALVQVEETTVRAWLERGLAHTEEAGEIKVRRADLDAFLAQENQGQANDAAEV